MKQIAQFNDNKNASNMILLDTHDLCVYLSVKGEDAVASDKTR